MFKIFKPNRRKWQSKDKPSSMPHRTSNFNFQQLIQSKQKNMHNKTQQVFSIGSLTNRFLQSSTSRSSNRGLFNNGDNVQLLLKNKVNDKAQIYSSQKSLRKNLSSTQRYFLNGQKSTSNLMDFKKSSLFKIDLNKFRNSQPRKESSQILQRSKDLISSQSFRRSVDRSINKQIKKSNNQTKKKDLISPKKQQINQQSFNQTQNGRSQYCSIVIVYEQKGNEKQLTVRYKIKKIGALNQFLKNYLKQHQAKNRFSHQSSMEQKEIVSFETVDYNLQMDYYLTLDQEDGSFLNGQTILLRPVYSVKQPVITLNSFEIIQCIGSGGFSNVFLCRFKQNGKFYAMKVISKPFIVKNQKKKIIMNQRNIMVQLRDKINIAKLFYSFQAKQYIVFVMEYYEGGQLFNLVKRFRKMDQRTARFYITQILLGLQQIHDHNIVYRDFKPQNIMIDMDGHAYIADFGLAKPNISTIDDRAYSFCGSPQYMPPQMILKDGHSLPVDFYCLGALLYQLVTGLPPFYNADPQAIYQGTLNGQLGFPQHAILSNQLEDLLLNLLCKDQRYRLGSTFGVQQVLSHPWFRSIKRQDFRLKKINPPVNFKRIEDLRFNIDQMQDQNQKQMKQILKNQKLQLSAKYLKIMNGFYYDYRLNENIEQKQNIQTQMSKTFKKQKSRLSTQKIKNNSESIALTNCTRRSQNSLMMGNHLDIKSIGKQQTYEKQLKQKLYKNTKTQLLNQNKIFSKNKKLSQQLKGAERKMFKDMKNILI